MAIHQRERNPKRVVKQSGILISKLWLDVPVLYVQQGTTSIQSLTFHVGTFCLMSWWPKNVPRTPEGLLPPEHRPMQCEVDQWRQHTLRISMFLRGLNFIPVFHNFVTVICCPANSLVGHGQNSPTGMAGQEECHYTIQKTRKVFLWRRL